MTERYSLHALFEDWAEDARAFVRHGLQARSGWRGRLQLVSAALMPNVVCCLTYRVARWLYCHRCRWLAAAVSRLGHTLFGASLSPGGALGGGLYLPHPVGVVIQAHAGPGLRVYAGGNIVCRPHRPLDARPLSGAPEFGRDVLVGAKAVLSGPIQLGDAAVISFNAVVDRTVPAGSSAHQSPLRNYRLR